MKGLFRRANVPLLTSEEIDVLRNLQREWERIDAHRKSCNHRAAAEAITAARTRYMTEHTDESWNEYKQMESDPEEIRRRHVKMSRAVHAALSSFYAEKVIPAVSPIYVRAAERAEREADRLEAQERENAASVEIPFEPSPTLEALQSKAYSLRCAGEQLKNSDQSPKDLLADIAPDIFE